MNANSILSGAPVTKNLIIINFIVWLAMLVLPSRIGVNIEDFGGLHYFGASDFNPAQLLTYMFMHSTQSFAHILFNMFALFMFGWTLERVLGSKRFLFYYISCGIGAAILQELTWALTWENTFVPIIANLNGISFDTARAAIQEAVANGEDLPFLNALVTIGASGAVYGILLAFGMLFPNRPLYIMFIPIPIKAKWMVIGYGALELLVGMAEFWGRPDGVAHFAHLGGMIFGFFIIWYWKKKGVVRGDYF
ncbi:MAG: rhomboid family intramembrane serine protease [Muribaculaceae bacterium]|nr:rhomboid family intramembrane serine protease [Muribaculaceae bacterium]